MADWDLKAKDYLAGKETTDPSGYLGRLTPKEQECLDWLRAAIDAEFPDLGFSDADLLRYLRARDFHKEQSLKMVRATAKWLAETRPAEIDMGEYREVHDNGFCLPAASLRDKSGRPLIWCFSGKYDPAVTERANKNLLKMLVTKVDLCHPPNETLTFAFDMTGYGRKNADTKWCANIIHSLQNHFPEPLGLCLVINAPVVFTFLWKIVKPWMTERTTSKVLFVTGDYKQRIKAFIDDDMIPMPLGGTMTLTPEQWAVQQWGAKGEPRGSTDTQT